MSESLGLKFDKFITVDSKAISIVAKLGKLSTLLITKRNQYVTVPKWAKFSRGDDKQIVDMYGHASVLAFARNYFGFQNRASDFADTLHVYTWASDKEQLPALVGANTPPLDELKKVNGKISLTIDGTTKNIDVNLAGKNSHTEIATELQNAVRKNNNAVNGFKDATVAWSSIHNGFVVTAGAGTTFISYASTPTEGNDMSAKLGLSQGEGARLVEPYKKLDTLPHVLVEVSRRNDTYFFITFDFEVDTFDKDLLPIGEWVEASRGQYCVLYSTTQPSMLTQPTFTRKLHGFNGLVLEYTPNLRITNGKSAGIFSSTDYSKPRGNLSFIYNKIEAFRDVSIKDEDQYDTVTNPTKNRSNAYVTARRLTHGYTWYMPGNVMGGDTEHLNVYVSNFVITQYLQQGFAMWLTNNTFPSVSDSTAIQLYANSVMQQCLGIGLMTTVDSLDVDETQQLSATFRKVADATASLVSNGFYTEVGDFDAQQRCVNIKIAYIANVPIRKLCIKLHALRG